MSIVCELFDYYYLSFYVNYLITTNTSEYEISTFHVSLSYRYHVLQFEEMAFSTSVSCHFYEPHGELQVGSMQL
jgi:hypothetical protein